MRTKKKPIQVETELAAEPEIVANDDAVPDGIEGVQRYAFDEMNLVELPFALLTDAKELRKGRIGELPLGPGGQESLVASGRHSLPTALAERVVLGVLWLTQQRNGFKDPVVRFPLRNLIHDYMYPDRTANNRVGGAFYKRVEEELHRVAHTRIVSSRWYDKQLKRVTQMDASIIDYIQVIEEGGRNKSRILEMRWGAKLFKSIQDRYTKSIDVRTILQIDRPMDLRFYRWLDRQLAVKRVQVVASCQNFARFKLLMRGQKIDRGGRTASSYVVAKLTEALERLNSVGFAVRMTVDESLPDYRLTFERINGKRNEALAVDAAGELVREFQHVAHGLPKNAPRRRVSAADREEAQRWLEEYGPELARWMVKRCVQLHQKTARREEPIFRFRGLHIYESKALADHEATHGVTQRTAMEKNAERARQKAWEEYRDEQLAQAKTEMTADQLKSLRAKVQSAVEKDYAGTKFKPSGKVMKELVEAALERRILEDAGVLAFEQFDVAD